MDIDFKDEYMSLLEIARLFRYSKAGITKIVRKNNIRTKWEEKGSGRNAHWLVNTADLVNYFKQFNQDE